MGYKVKNGVLTQEIYFCFFWSILIIRCRSKLRYYVLLYTQRCNVTLIFIVV